MIVLFFETYVNSDLEHGLIPLINKPTGVPSHSTTVIDHIFPPNVSQIPPPPPSQNECNTIEASLCLIHQITLQPTQKPTRLGRVFFFSVGIFMYERSISPESFETLIKILYIRKNK